MSVAEESDKVYEDGERQRLLNVVRGRCHGVPPLDAKLDGWMIRSLGTRQSELRNAVERWGSPLNIICTNPLVRNIRQLDAVADGHGLSFQIFFARKANKCLALVDAAVGAGAGIDVASEQECKQVLDRGVLGQDLICTAAVKTKALVELCVRSSVPIVIDNFDELACVSDICHSINLDATAAIRVSGFQHEGTKLQSRFGFDVDQVPHLVAELRKPSDRRIRLEGIHFHLDSYSAGQRVSAIGQCLPLIDDLRSDGHEIRFLDIGGGIPMSYLESESQWRDFWTAHRAALLGQREPITYRNHGLGMSAMDGNVHGPKNVYPYFQSPVQQDWVGRVLRSSFGDGSIAEAIRRRSLQLRCEPGRSVLDGCGFTTARVEFTKRHPSGHWFVGLAMNHTQCRTSSDDFMVDPLVIPGSSERAVAEQSMEGYLVGAYCTESELLCLRRLRFPRGIAKGDLVTFPNTAGYLMHFLESRSHQFQLALNLIVDESTLDGEVDAIDTQWNQRSV